MVYHPDKQSNNNEASDIFIRIQEAFNVLSDPTKRHIYDVYGKSGLDADWQIMERRKTAQEMQEEYERIQRIRAQQRLEERTHPEGTFSMMINATSLFDENQFDDEYYDPQIMLPDITALSITQSIQAPLSPSHTATLTGNLQTKNGNGHVNPVAAFYGTFVPLAIYAGVHYLIIRPYRKQEKERQSEESEESLTNETKRRKEEAEATIKMMKQSSQRKIDAEERKLGLVITEAWYGRFVSEDSSRTSKLIDVRIPLQNLVENSKLQLPAGITKSGLPGFYDPCPGSEIKLKVVYKFRGGVHKASFDDRDAVRIPLRSHSVDYEPSN
uniref:J domain-containing protein n=1 Tax=Ciona savignyi TaxID=51511 RepID=H2ZE52_CIOSA